MGDRPDLDQVLTAITCLQSAAVTLTEYARDLAADPAARLSTVEDAPEEIAEALARALDALPDGHEPERNSQLRGALARFLEGWM